MKDLQTGCNISIYINLKKKRSIRIIIYLYMNGFVTHVNRQQKFVMVVDILMISLLL